MRGVQSLERGNWREWAVDARLRVCLMWLGGWPCVSEVAALLVMLPSFLSDFRVFWANGLSLTSTLEQLFSLCTLPITSVIVWLRWSRCGWGLDASQLLPPHSSEDWHLWRADCAWCPVSAWQEPALRCTRVAGLSSAGAPTHGPVSQTRTGRTAVWGLAVVVQGRGRRKTRFLALRVMVIRGWLSGSWSWFKAAGVGSLFRVL